QELLVSGYSNLVILRLLAELGVVGVIAIWVASLLAVKRDRALAAAAVMRAGPLIEPAPVVAHPSPTA
ncbi:MAG: hypothetical protein ACREOM_01475, partial [Candidatus Dormibacteraceae bacterium]